VSVTYDVRTARRKVETAIVALRAFGLTDRAIDTLYACHGYYGQSAKGKLSDLCERLNEERDGLQRAESAELERIRTEAAAEAEREAVNKHFREVAP
jgi:hypothetical protein